MSYKRTTAPASTPVTLAEAKAHLRVDVTDDDALITGMIDAATDMAESQTGRALMLQTWDLTLDGFTGEITIGIVPAVAVTSFGYTDAAGALQTLSAGAYTIDTANDYGPGRIVPTPGTSWPATRGQANAVVVRFTAGYPNAAAVPGAIKAWILLQVGAMYENRQAETDRMPFSLGFADRLLDRYKVWAL